MRILLVLLFLVFPILDEAGAVALDTSKVSTFQFRDAQFGQPPLYDMVCFHGYCKSQAPGGDGRVKIPFNVYTRPSDLPSIAGVEISPPKYSYWKDQLFRILIQIKCPSGNTRECFDIVLDEIAKQDALTFLTDKMSDLVSIGIRMSGRSYLTNSGALLSAIDIEKKGSAGELRIDIWDKKLRDEVALAGNPNYRAPKVLVPKK